jgi:hypothetical protein
MGSVSLAKHLSDFLRLLYAHRNRGEAAIDVFAGLLSIDSSNQLEVIVQLSNITTAIDKLRQQVHSLDDWSDDLRISTLGSLDKIYKIFSVTGMGSSFGSVISQISDSDLVMLSLLDRVLYLKHPVPQISDMDVAQFREKINELIADIQQSALSKEAKALFSEHLVRLMLAFDQNKYFGVDAAWKVLGAMTVDLSRQGMADPSEKRGVLLRIRMFGKSVLRVLSVADQVNSGLNAIEDISSRIPGGLGT